MGYQQKPDLRKKYEDWALPINETLEQDILTHALNDKIYKILDFVKDTSIFNNQDRIDLFECFLELNERGEDITAMNVFRLTGNKELVQTCTNLKTRIASDMDIPIICLTLIEISISRKVIIRCGEVLETLYKDTTKSLGIVDELSEFSQDINDSLSQLNQISFQRIKENVINEIEERVKNPNGVVVNSGVSEFDKVFGGFEKGTFTVFGARPGAGKTALMVQIAYNVAVKLNKKILFFNLEMTKEELVKRLLALHTTYSNFTLKKGFDGDMSKFENFKKLAQTLTTENIIIKDDIYDARQINQITKRMVKNNDVEIMILDYLQLSGLKDAGNREQEISKISRGLKRLSKDAKIPVVSLTQLNRGVEGRNDKRPQLSDIRESGAIEQDADSVVFLFRPEYYNIKEKEGGGTTENLLELIIAKARNGFTGTVEVQYMTKFNSVKSFNEVDSFIPNKIVGNIDDFENEIPKQLKKVDF
jgi:replicative DNA helicase